MIESKDNKKVKYARSLYMYKNRKKFNQFIVEGKKNIEIAKATNSIDYILTTNPKLDGILISENVMKSITSTVSNIDSVAVCNIPSIKSKCERVLMLDGIQDPGNLGTLIRSAVAFNFDTIICSKNTVDYTNPKVVRASSGSIFLIKIIYDDLINAIKISSNKTIGTFVDGKNKLEKLDKFNLVIGNEGNGISDEIRSLCDIKYRIEINEKLESLNAAIAGSIVMHQLGGKK